MQRPDYSLPVIVPEFTDYSKWERKPSAKSGSSGASRGRGTAGGTGKQHVQLGPRQGAFLPLASEFSQATVLVARAPEHVQHGHRQGVGKKLSRSGSPRAAKHSTCSHERQISRSRAVLSPRYALLRMQIQAKCRSIEEFKKYKDDLLASNLVLIDTIRHGEHRVNSGVQDLLEIYRKSRGSLSALQKKNGRDKKEAQAELEKTREWVHKKVEALRKEVHEADILLQSKSKESDILKGFKEKEYMVNQVHIEQLREEIKEHTQECEESITALDGEIEEERGKCQEMVAGKKSEIEAYATEECIGRIKKSVKEKGIQNRIMEKEIILHSRKAEALQSSMDELRIEIGQLRLALREDKRRRNPLLVTEKCRPDTELQLNIPVQNCLPL